MKQFETDRDAAKNWVLNHNIEDLPNSTRRFTFEIKPGDHFLGDRGQTRVMQIGEELAELRRTAGVPADQITIARGHDRVSINTTARSWQKLQNFLDPERAREGGWVIER